MYLFDTNICIFLIKEKSPNLLKRVKLHRPGTIFISSVTLAELLYGVEKSMHKDRNFEGLVLMTSAIQVLDFDSQACFEYGKIRADLESKGRMIGSLDCLIGAHALALDFTLVTNNVKEFQRINDLRVEDWS